MVEENRKFDDLILLDIAAEKFLAHIQHEQILIASIKAKLPDPNKYDERKRRLLNILDTKRCLNSDVDEHQNVIIKIPLYPRTLFTLQML